MSRNLSKNLRHWFKLPSNAIDNEKGITPLALKRPEAAINKFAQGFISHIDASGLIDPATKQEALREETSTPQGEGSKSANAKGEWTFHSPKPASDVSMGYLHNAGHRLITTETISKLDLKALLRYVKEMPKYDEYTEIIVIGQKPAGPVPQTDPHAKWELCFVDHFNRRFLTLEEFENDPNRDWSDAKTSECSYREWMKLVTSGNSHYYKPSSNEKKQCLGRKIAQQIVWDYQTAHVVKDIDIEGAFSTSDCSSLLSALQKKRVSDKQCQKMIEAVIQRFLHCGTSPGSAHTLTNTRVTTATPISQRPQIKKNFDAEDKIAHAGPFTTCGMALFFVAWTGPLLHVPFPYFRRLQLLSTRADQGEYVPDLWKTFIKAVLKEWTDLNIILALILAANVAFLALPGTSGNIPEGKPVALAYISRAAGIISMFMTMSGLLTSLCLIWIHSPLRTTGGFDAYRYIIGPSYKSNSTTSEDLIGHNSFMQLAWMASYLGMPLVLLLWSVIAFVVSAATWIFLFSEASTQITTVTVCGVVLLSPVITLLVFRGPTMSGESLFSKMLRSQPETQSA